MEEKKKTNPFIALMAILGTIVFTCFLGIFVNGLIVGIIDPTLNDSSQAAPTKAPRNVQLENCLNTAEASYNSRWKNTCEIRELGDDCSLPSDVAEKIEDLRIKDKEICISAYK